MRPIVITVAHRHSSMVEKIVELLVEHGAEAYYGRPGEQLQQLRWLWNPLIVQWAAGGNKFHELRRLAAAGVPAPRFSQAPVPGWLARRQYHQEGRDFSRPPAYGDFYTEPTFTNHEFRVHVIHDIAFRTQYKYLPEGVEALVYGGVPIRNHTLGWRFDPRPDNRFPEPMLATIRTVARDAVRAMGYTIGVADIGWIVGSNGLIPSRAVVFEVNTRPTMDEYTQAAYVQALLKLAEGR